MRRRSTLIATWLSTTVVATALATQAMRFVGNEIVDARVAPLAGGTERSPAERETVTTAAASPTSPTSSAVLDEPTPSSETAIESTEADPVVDDALVGGPVARPTRTTAPRATTNTATTTTSSSSRDAKAPAPATSAPSATAERRTTTTMVTLLRTYQVTGGRVQVAFAGDDASLEFAAPSSGWRMTVVSHGPERVEVLFDNGDLESRVKAWWRDGPRSRIDDSVRTSTSGPSTTKATTTTAKVTTTTKPKTTTTARPPTTANGPTTAPTVTAAGSTSTTKR